MGIPLDSRIKGAIALEIVSAILLDAGFRILRLGVEELIPSIKTASQNAYRKLDLSRTLTSTPDLLVIAPGEEGSVVTEVKFRARWTAETRTRLFETAALVEQVRRWGPMYLVIAVAQSPKSRSTISDHLRVMAVRYDAETRQIVFFRILAAIDEAKGGHGPALDKLKKSELAVRAAQIVAGTGWLPAPLRGAAPEAEIADEGDDGE